MPDVTTKPPRFRVNDISHETALRVTEECTEAAKSTFWQDNDPPMSFVAEGWSYQKRRAFRYSKIDYLLPILENLGERFKGKRVLCIGDGGGLDAVELARAGCHVLLVDISSKAVEIAQKTALEAQQTIATRVASAENLPSGDGQFDLVYSFGVFHHIPNVDVAVSEVLRALKPGGTFAGMVYNADSLLYAYSILMRGMREGLTPAQAMQKWSERNEGCPHSVAYTVESLKALLSRFSSLAIETLYDVVDLPNERKIPFQLESDAKLGWHLFFHADK